MLVHHIQAPDSGVDVQQVVGRAASGFDPERLTQAYEATLARRDALRFVFQLEGRSEAAAILLEDVEPDVRHLCWTHMAPDTVEAALVQWLCEDRVDGFDIHRRPPTRLTTIDLGHGRGFFIWTFHHLLLDGRSIPLVLRDLMGWLLEAPLERAPRFAPWLSKLPGVQAGTDSTRVAELVADVAAPTPLEFGFPLRCPAIAGDPRYVDHHGSKEEVAAVEAAAARFGVRPGTMVHAAWAVLLSRYADEPEVVFGSTRACRYIAGLEQEPVAGMFINTVPMRLGTGSEHTVAELLMSTRAQQLEQRSFERLGLADATALSQVPAGTPLFESLVVFDDATVDHRVRASGLELGPWRFEYHGQTNFPLTLAGYLQPDLELRIEYDPTRIDRNSASRILHDYRRALFALCDADANQHLADLGLLDPNEHERLVFGLNDTDVDVATSPGLHLPFVEMAETAPERTALRCGASTWSYEELRGRMRALAARLAQAGVHPGDRVAVALPRGFELIAGLLAVLEAGGTYVPVDLAYPPQRQRFMIEDSGVRLVLTDAAHRADFPYAATIDVEGSVAPAVQLPAPEADNLAYIIYTSGSSGQPKGVEVSHAAALNLIQWVNQTYDVGPEDELLFVTSPCFDLSVYDIFGTLAAGGCVAIATEAELDDPAILAERLFTGGITIWDSAPGALDRLVPLFPRQPVESSHLRLVLLSGDWIPVRMPDEVRAAFHQARIIALGGATEASIWSNAYEVGDVDPRWPSIPYGKPIQNARYHVLDRLMRPSPVGAAGELYIGGPCLARGYHRRPDLNAERFIVDPFRPGQRLYRTGDRARVMPDGNLEFLGRLDGQVKIRGYRVELGEVSALLQQQPRVEQAVVGVTGERETKRLVAFTVLTRGTDRHEAVVAMEASLRESLPAYMVPSQFVPVEALPLTANGKIDYRALSELARASTRPSNDRALENDDEVHVALLWEQLLGNRPGPASNFFRCGGNSILAVRLAAQLHDRLGVKPQLAEIFRNPTVEGIAASLRTGKRARRATVVPLTTAPEHLPPFYMLLGVYHYHALAKEMASWCAPTGIIVPSEQTLVDDPLASVSVERLASEYAMTIAREHPGGPVYLGGLSFGGMLAFEAARQLTRAGLDVAMVVLIDTIPPSLVRAGRLRSILHQFVPRRLAPPAPLVRALRNLRNAQGPGNDLDTDAERGDPHRAYRYAAMLYEAGSATYDGEVLLLRAEESLALPKAPPDLDWEWRVEGPFEQVTLPGGHLSMLQAPFVAGVADFIRSRVVDAEAASGG